jgi:ubiquinone/menaquinone biosynthesis C-methylase UbiE
MDWLGWAALLGGLVIIGLILYWQLIITEGTYLGAPLVALLYDWAAAKYNTIKEFDPYAEDFCFGRPLAARLGPRAEVTILDVAAGTGRVAQTLLRQPNFKGRVIGLDRSPGMLRVARQEAAGLNDRAFFMVADAMALPFADNSVPSVTCLEAMEFMPRPETGLGEMVRVLQPKTAGQLSRGWLLTTRRVGWEARLMPGKTWTYEQLEAILRRLRLQQIDIQIWEDIYDLVWAQKSNPDEAAE